MRGRPQLLRFPPLTKTALWKPLRFVFAFARREANHFPQIFFRICFRNGLLANQNKIPEIFFRFRFRKLKRRENPKSWDSYLFSLVIVSVRMAPRAGSPQRAGTPCGHPSPLPGALFPLRGHPHGPLWPLLIAGLSVESLRP